MPLDPECVGRAPVPTDHHKTFSTSPSSRIRNPSTPCWIGDSPVVIEVSAAAVVDGATVVIGPPTN